MRGVQDPGGRREGGPGGVLRRAVRRRQKLGRRLLLPLRAEGVQERQSAPEQRPFLERSPPPLFQIVLGNCGVLHEMQSLDGKGFVEMTGIDAETSRDIHDVITGQGGRYLEAQIQGNKTDADKGNLVVLGAGDRTLFDECQTCFQAMGRTAFYLGEIGYAAKINSILQVRLGCEEAPWVF